MTTNSEILDELARWMPVNGEAIFGTRPWKVYGEGPSRVNSGGFNEGKLRYTAKDIRFTTKGGRLYALALGWPEDRRLVIRSLATPAGKITQGQSARLTGANSLGSKPMPAWPSRCPRKSPAITSSL